ncbi:hypothetical protein PHISCL_00385 [Aspergillus sclerotialis]|uniref:Uncharacterized protein n=1 Tax=Aspergillus sclerotialis TaxID=2070753 RepID=A0A3A3A6D2_9EURO|nr:hypothetical protein PHISCL_00385 [Aspergillus sclerotialis]
MKPQPLADGIVELVNFILSQMLLSLIDICDRRKLVGAILIEPGKFEGQVLSASERLSVSIRRGCKRIK